MLAKSMKNLVTFAASLAAALGAGALGSLFTAPAIDTWYALLTKPELAPPNWVFGPVWTALYVLMAVAAYLVWQKEGVLNAKKQIAKSLYAFQLGANVSWSYFFFNQQDIGFAFGVLVGLWVLVALTIWAFYKISKPAALLLVPYLLWLTFAGYLNYQIWILN